MMLKMPFEIIQLIKLPNVRVLCLSIWKLYFRKPKKKLGMITGFDINPRPTDFVCLLLGPVGLDPPDTSPTGHPNFKSTFVLYKFFHLQLQTDLFAC